MDRKEHRIASLPLFAGCRYKDICWIASNADAVDVRPGSVVCASGRTARELIVVMEGAVTAGGKTYGPGAFFGHEGLLDRLPHEVSVVAGEGVRVLVVPVGVFTGMLERCPSVARRLLRDVVSEIRELDRSTTRPWRQSARRLRAVS